MTSGLDEGRAWARRRRRRRRKRRADAYIK